MADTIPTPTSGGGMSAGDITGIASSVVTTVGGILIASKSEKENRKLQEEISKLSLEQQRQLAEKQLAVKTELEKMSILYQYLAVTKNDTAMAALSKERYVSMIVLGGSLFLLAGIIIFTRKK